MGIIFLEHPGGDRFFCCRKCECPLACATQENVVVEASQGTAATNPTRMVYLFKKTVNIEQSTTVYHQKEADRRGATTGKKMVRDVNCKKCKTKLGWLNEFIEDASQQYKEGKMSISGSRILCKKGIDGEKSLQGLNGLVGGRLQPLGGGAARDIFRSNLERLHDELNLRIDADVSDTDESDTDSEGDDLWGDDEQFLQGLQFIIQERRLNQH